MNNIYGIIWEQCNPGIQSFLKGNEDFPSRFKCFDALWLIQETKKITALINVKINKSDSLYHCIRRFTNLRKGENEPNDTFKLRWGNFYETMDLVGGENILISNQLVKVSGDQA